MATPQHTSWQNTDRWNDPAHAVLTCRNTGAPVDDCDCQDCEDQVRRENGETKCDDCGKWIPEEKSNPVPTVGICCTPCALEHLELRPLSVRPAVRYHNRRAS